MMITRRQRRYVGLTYLLPAVAACLIVLPLAAQDPDVPATRLLENYQGCITNALMLPKLPNKSAQLKLYNGKDDVLLVSVPHSRGFKRKKAELLNGKWIGQIYNFGSSEVPDFSIQGTGNVFDPSVTCVWVSYDPGQDTGIIAFVHPEQGISRYRLKREKQDHDDSGTDWNPPSLYMAAIRKDPVGLMSLIGWTKKPIPAKDMAELVTRLKNLWYVCDGGGCCKSTGAKLP